jgi:hypothetical protein
VLFGTADFDAKGELDIVKIPTVPGVATRTSVPMHLGYYAHASELLAMKPTLLARMEAFRNGPV